jgi:hypothetical protein
MPATPAPLSLKRGLLLELEVRQMSCAVVQRERELPARTCPRPLCPKRKTPPKRGHMAARRRAESYAISRPSGLLLLPDRQAHDSLPARSASFDKPCDIRTAVDTGRWDPRDVAGKPGSEANPPGGRLVRAGRRLFHAVSMSLKSTDFC